MQTTTTPKSGPNLLVIFLALFVCLFLSAAIGLGVWGYQLNTELQAVQAQEAELQTNFNTLSADKDGTNAALAQAKTDLEGAKASLEQTKTDLATAETDLVKSQETAVALQERIANAQKYLNILIVYYIDEADFNSLNGEIRDVDDPELEDIYDQAVSSNTTRDFIDWLSYLFDTTADFLTLE